MKESESRAKFKSKRVRSKAVDSFGRNLIHFVDSQNRSFDLTGYKYKSEKLPEEFDGFRIIQLSDIHNRIYGCHSEELIKKIKVNKPDIIVITGDTYDAHIRQYEDSLKILSQIVNICPVYMITGNHEELTPTTRDEFLPKVEALGINMLYNDSVNIRRGNSEISLIGIRDYISNALNQDVIDRAFDKLLEIPDEDNMVAKSLETLKTVYDNAQCDFKILLSHRPELFEDYVDNGFDLVFTGHAHGGQFVVPGIGGLFAPNQGLLPKYTQSFHEKGSTTMIVSRGLGNSSFPLRINNHPEIVVAELHHLYKEKDSSFTVL